jgi:type VI secretion system secreted protein VgrG
MTVSRALSVTRFAPAKTEHQAGAEKALRSNHRDLGVDKMQTYTQGNRPLAIATPLGKDVLLLTGFRGHETISQLYNFQVDLLAEAENKIRFDRIMGQNVTVEMRLANEEKRYFNGLVKRFSQGARDDVFVHFRAELVPKLWLLTKKFRSRIFQHLSVPDILRQVLSELDVTYELSETYYQRDYCVQYRESDFDFASRLMEEEGIYYFFKHFNASHQLVVTDVSSRHPSVAGQSNIIYEEMSGGVRKELRITAWEKSQELRSGEYTLWDHCFELPGKNLGTRKKTTDSVTVGEVNHKLSVGGNDQLEIYDYPGGYAQRFDGVNRNGAAQPEDLKDIFPDGERTVRVRMEQEEAESVEVVGTSNCGHFVAGHKFALEQHFDGNDEYLLTRIEHNARLDGDYRSNQALEFDYQNRFTCIPVALPYRPQRVTRKPVIAGVQTATVVGPHGDEIFCDKYGRVKVQFHWDREGKKNADSSCWLRVAQVWAGKGWGAFFWPRIGHEVVVVFEEGDPDQPLIVGSVYNAENMPWFSLPANKQLGGFKSASERGTAQKNYNGIVFNDEKGKEHLSVHSEHNLSLNSEHDKMVQAGRHKGERVGIANVLTVGKLIPSGGSGGGGFDEGDAWPHPQPQGIVGMNSVVTYGDNMQVACPINHQLAVGNNVQICINPFGLAAGVPGAPFPEFMQAILGSGMGGNMQFTVGTSAQFTLGQSFEISVGPPKIEIHQDYDGHLPVSILCGVLSGIAIVFVLAYDLIPTYSANQSDPKAVNQHNEQAGDKDRATLALAYQLVVDALLVAILAVESAIDNIEWLADDTLKKLYKIESSCLMLWKAPDVKPQKDITPNWWNQWGAVSFGCLGAVAAIEAEIIATSGEFGG